ncbi:MAG: Wzz/FepE/Etk N-terminal domain-containing protein [Chloroflexaceae bacterium]|jgi:capsular polysaccharide biosynthesis protein|nr:Wzz/FepE/Etk N-terminal domain-containing protein [Chloroflexaceae bacterium]
MQLQDYANVLVKRWWVIGLAALAAAIVAFGVSRVLPREYRTQAVYLASPNQFDFGATMALRNTLNTYRELVVQPDVLAQLSQQLRMDVSGERLMQDVNMQPRPDEQKLVIEVDRPTQEQAVALAEVVGQRLEAESIRINASQEGTARVNVQRIQSPRLISTSPNTRTNVLAGAILGLLIGILLAFVLEFLDDTLKTTNDVDRFVGLTTLGAIPTVDK